MMNGWTGGQYSLYRAALGGVLVVLSLRQLWLGQMAESSPALPDLPLVVPYALLVLLALASTALAVGWKDRAAALALWLSGAILLLLGQITWTFGLVPLGWILLFHALLPVAPYGSLDARGRVDPDGGWVFPPLAYHAAWIVLGLCYVTLGIGRLFGASWIPDPAIGPQGLVWPGTLALVEITGGVLLLSQPLHLGLWVGLLLLETAALGSFGAWGTVGGLVALHGLTFDPHWVPARPARSGATERLFYDGTCGLCHRAVRFLLAEDRQGRFRIAVLGGESFRATVPEEQMDEIPDSLVVSPAPEVLLFRYPAVLHLGARLGGLWTLLATLGRLVPTALGDAAYGLVARIRHRLFARPKDVCPLMPPGLGQRFDP